MSRRLLTLLGAVALAAVLWVAWHGMTSAEALLDFASFPLC